MASTTVNPNNIPTTMSAITIPPAFSPGHPATGADLILSTLPTPIPTEPDQYLVRVHAAAITRDELLWPQTYTDNSAPVVPGHDFSGVIVALPPPRPKDNSSANDDDDNDNDKLNLGDAVYGSLAFGRAWAEYMLVPRARLALKPASLTHAQAAAVPKSGATAWTALFEKAGLSIDPSATTTTAAAAAAAVAATTTPTTENKKQSKRILITGAAGGVGTYAVQLARLAAADALSTPWHVVAATSSTARNDALLLRQLRADESVQYDAFPDLLSSSSSGDDGLFDVVFDTVGGSTLRACWALVAPRAGAKLITIDAHSFGFAEAHRAEGAGGPAAGKEDVDAFIFVVDCARRHMEALNPLLEKGLVTPFVAEVVEGIEETGRAYRLANEGRLGRPGKAVVQFRK